MSVLNLPPAASECHASVPRMAFVKLDSKLLARYAAPPARNKARLLPDLVSAVWLQSYTVCISMKMIFTCYKMHLKYHGSTAACRSADRGAKHGQQTANVQAPVRTGPRKWYNDDPAGTYIHTYSLASIPHRGSFPKTWPPSYLTLATPVTHFPGCLADGAAPRTYVCTYVQHSLACMNDVFI